MQHIGSNWHGSDAAIVRVLSLGRGSNIFIIISLVIGKTKDMRKRVCGEQKRG